jgi:threonine/homoserine/homoserine lactone efflux protein
MDIIFANNTDLVYWLSVGTVCILGAMSPGPSLALIINYSLSQGRLAGICAALAHGLCIGIYAFLTAFGLLVVIDKNPLLFDAIQIFGSLFLLQMAIKLLLAPMPNQSEIAEAVRSSYWKASRDGFLIALVNPKVILFFTAIFSQFIRVDGQAWERSALILVAAGVDALWYVFVALLISQSSGLNRWGRKSWWLDKVFSVLLFAISLSFIFEIVQRSDLGSFFNSLLESFV